MKKLFAILLAVMMLASMATIASAASTTMLTTTVPAASYTLNIPADQPITFNETATDIGVVSISNASGFAVGKSLRVSMTYGDFSCENISTTIPMSLDAHFSSTLANSTSVITEDIVSGGSLLFVGTENGDVAVPERKTHQTHVFDGLIVNITSDDWGKALAGEYTATITFTAEVVAE